MPRKLLELKTRNDVVVLPYDNLPKNVLQELKAHVQRCSEAYEKGEAFAQRMTKRIKGSSF